MEMISKHNFFSERYKVSIYADFDGIDAPLEGLLVTLREEMTNKIFLDTKGNMNNFILSIYSGWYSMGKGKIIGTDVFIQE